MLHITQVIYLHPGPEAEQSFLEFESRVLPLMSNHGGELLLRLRPQKEQKIEGSLEPPFEVHLVSFPSEESLAAYLNDPERLKYLHLKEQAIREAVVYR
ncbi:MAG TPA: DUF1330 domain-containing protein [Saprospiraceae bacterium]|nr:DUF1330 domain-containing protein [Saprospiraceae bacterium]HNT21759.1 DUF1330 domain-containing protein [Saprospiraceae bacterium]